MERDEILVAKPFKVEATDTTGEFAGLGAVFNDMHPTSSWALDENWKDRILPGAFKRTLEAHERMGTTPPMLWMHERGNVIGAWRELGEVGSGLHVRGQLALSARAPSGVSIHELAKMGAVSGLSIGFRVRKAELDQDKKVRSITEVELSEVSVVDVPGIHRARITDVKTVDPKILENVLREAGLSREEAKAILAKGLRALREVEAQKGEDDELREAAASDPLKQKPADVLVSIRALTQLIRSQ